jgi:predicted metalloprotease with PDZ domain
MIVPELEDISSTVAVTGNYRYSTVEAGDTELVLAIAGDWPFDDGELFDVIRSIAENEIASFGSSTHDRYLFVCDYNPVKGGEGFNYYGIHSNGSIVLLLDPRMSGARLFDVPMAIVAHEFFHNWNGEALRPRSNEFLWFTEGVTVYYSYRVLLDTKIITQQQYERERMSIEERFRGNPYRESVPIRAAANSDLSDKDMVNLLYDGGFLAAEALDGKLAELTGGGIRLIDILRLLYEHNPGGSDIDEETLAAVISETCGHDLTGFLGRLVDQPASPLLD